MKTKSLLLVISSLLFCCITSAATNDTKANLKPVEGIFGWKLGDKFPAALKSNERYNADNQVYRFNPKTGLPMLDSHDWLVWMLNDGRIYSLDVSAYTDSRSEFEEGRDRLIAILSEKYGLRETSDSDGSGLHMKWYFFGTKDRTVELFTCIRRDSATCDLQVLYYDDTLKKLAGSEQKARDEKAGAAKKAELGKSL